MSNKARLPFPCDAEVLTCRWLIRADGNLLEVIKNLATISRAPIQVRGIYS